MQLDASAGSGADTLLPVTTAATEAPRPQQPKVSSEIEGAIGLLVHDNPSYPGASDRRTRINPAGFLRWGRITITGAGGFTTRRQDDVERGLEAELVRETNVRVGLGLRFDNGRSESASPRLAGMGGVAKTVRARLSARWDLDKHWRLGAGISLDALNRGGGYLVDVSIVHQRPLTRDITLTASAAMTAAGDRYLQAWHGVTAQQAARSGHPVYTAREGLRDVQLGVVLRWEFSSHWAGYAGVSASQLLGSAADSPLTFRAASWGSSSGLVWRF